jgi:uncharacterized RDD family membrane protein YckC
MQRFDEVELQAAVPIAAEIPAAPTDADDESTAPRLRRLFALLIDLSLFAALTLALSPLLPPARTIASTTALAGFVLMTSYYYFAGSWLLWGKTVGGTIFDVRIVHASDSAMSVKSVSMRWLGVLLSLLTGGIGFLFALPNRISNTKTISA